MLSKGRSNQALLGQVNYNRVEATGKIQLTGLANS